MKKCVFSPDLEAYYQELEAQFICYLGETKKQLYLSLTESLDIENFACKKFDFNHRWSESYKNRFVARLCRLQEWYLLNPYPVTFLTLTTHQEKNMMIEDQVTLLKDSWNKLRDVLKRMRPGLDYFCSMDFHKSGYAHYHVILFCTLRKDEEKKIRYIWSERYQAGHSLHGVNFKVQMKDNIHHLISYILKHTSKVLHSDQKTPGFLRFHSVIWNMGRVKEPGVIAYKRVRLFSVSRRLSNVMKLSDQNVKAVKVVHVGNSVKTLYEDHDVDEYDNAAWYRFEEIRNAKKVKREVEFFCNLDFE